MKMGIPYLIKSLNVNFIRHIKKSLPNIRNNLIELINVHNYFIFLNKEKIFIKRLKNMN